MQTVCIQPTRLRTLLKAYLVFKTMFDNQSKISAIFLFCDQILSRRTSTQILVRQFLFHQSRSVGLTEKKSTKIPYKNLNHNKKQMKILLIKKSVSLKKICRFVTFKTYNLDIIKSLCTIYASLKGNPFPQATFKFTSLARNKVWICM